MQNINFQKLLFSIIGVFVAMDVIGILPIYIGITRSFDLKRRFRVVNYSIVVAATVALLFVFIGSSIFKFLGITLQDFQIGGGIVLLVMAILDLVHKKDHHHDLTSTGIVPLAMPLITGPGLITTVMLQVGLYGTLVVLLSLIINFLFTWLVLRNGNVITRLIGEEGTDIVSKIAALFMTAIACSMIRSGIFQAIKNGI